ncbi:unnamed protein product [Lupinus luteus]|uniref:Heparanase-like protein 3 n=1 Tax=Lupinus luteus TaxID=3873 RepID=A0AAV1WCK2_LUPLU
MGFEIRLLGRSPWRYYLLLLCFIVVNIEGDATENGSIFIYGKNSIGQIDDDFVCATLDWWPPQKCDYGSCSWGQASLFNLDLNNKILLNAVKAFTPLKLRLGGTLQDKLIYGTEDSHNPCTPFVKDITRLFHFTQGCLPLHRAKIIFGLNALAGKSFQGGSAVGPWNSTNAESFLRYTVKKNYTIHGWELGNELSGKGIGKSISAGQYAADVAALRKSIENVYRGVVPKPLVIAPGGFFDANWYKEFVTKAGKSVDVVTHHVYNLGPGVDVNLTQKILDPSYLDGEGRTFNNLKNILRTSATSATAWVGEAGGAYNSGRRLVSDAFVDSFWYLDQLGMSAVYDTKTYCRQTLIGGNYGLLDTKTFMPNPDYYSALLWHRLMGRRVLETSFVGTKKIRVYAHCAKQSKGITVLLLNLGNQTTVEAKLGITFAPIPSDSTKREEYHLTAKSLDIHSQTMLLNGNILSVDKDGNIPSLKPVYVEPLKPIVVAPLSVVFAHIPNAILPACT